MIGADPQNSIFFFLGSFFIRYSRLLASRPELQRMVLTSAKGRRERTNLLPVPR
jgi:hypothetical protein